MLFFELPDDATVVDRVSAQVEYQVRETGVTVPEEWWSDSKGLEWHRVWDIEP